MPKPNLEKQNKARRDFEIIKKELDNTRTAYNVDYNDEGADELRIYSVSFESVLIIRDDGTWGLE